MREVGDGLMREMPIKLSGLSPTAWRDAAPALSLTAAEREAVALLVLLDGNSLWSGIWDWVARERIAEGL